MLFLLAAGSLLIQAPIPDSLTLAQALSQARTARGQVMTATARVAAARAGFRQAGTIPNPNGNYEYTEDTPRQHLTFDQSFDWLLTRGPARDAANASITGALADSAQLEADLAAEVRRAFYSLVAARQLHTLVVAQAATDQLSGTVTVSLGSVAADDAAARTLSLLLAGGIPIHGMTIEGGRLSDAFLALTERQ